jgi:hypothetical protein
MKYFLVLSFKKLNKSGCGKSYFISNLEKFGRHIVLPNPDKLFEWIIEQPVRPLV